MYSLIHAAESVLAPLFKSLPPLPKNAKETLVKIWPVLALVLGILQLVAVISLWQLGHAVEGLIGYANTLPQYGYGQGIGHLGLFYWLALAALLLDGIILLLVYPKLKARQKTGWDLLFLGGLLNLAYGLLNWFDAAYGSFGNFLGALVGSAVGFYLLFQIREFYGGGKTAGSRAAAKSPAKK